MQFDVNENNDDGIRYHLTLDQNELQTFSDILSYVAGDKAVYDFLCNAAGYTDDNGYKRVQFGEDEFGFPVLRLKETKGCGDCKQCECNKVEYKYSEGNAFNPANMEIK